MRAEGASARARARRKRGFVSPSSFELLMSLLMLFCTGRRGTFHCDAALSQSDDGERREYASEPHLAGADEASGGIPSNVEKRTENLEYVDALRLPKLDEAPGVAKEKNATAASPETRGGTESLDSDATATDDAIDPPDPDDDTFADIVMAPSSFVSSSSSGTGGVGIAAPSPPKLESVSDAASERRTRGSRGRGGVRLRRGKKASKYPPEKKKTKELIQEVPLAAFARDWEEGGGGGGVIRLKDEDEGEGEGEERPGRARFLGDPSEGDDEEVGPKSNDEGRQRHDQEAVGSNNRGRRGGQRRRATSQRELLRRERKRASLTEALRKLSRDGPDLPRRRRLVDNLRRERERARRLAGGGAGEEDEEEEEELAPPDAMQALRVELRRKRMEEERLRGNRNLQNFQTNLLDNLENFNFVMVSALSPELENSRRFDDELYCLGVPEDTIDNVFVFQERPGYKLVLRNCYFSALEDIDWIIPTNSSLEDPLGPPRPEQQDVSVVDPFDFTNGLTQLQQAYSQLRRDNYRPPYIVALAQKNGANPDIFTDNVADKINWYDYWLSVDRVEAGKAVLADRRSVYDIDPTKFTRWNVLLGPAFDATLRPDLDQDGLGNYEQTLCASVTGDGGGGGGGGGSSKSSSSKSKRKNKNKNRNRVKNRNKSRRRRRRRLGDRDLEDRRVSLEACSEKSRGYRRQRQTWIYCGSQEFCTNVTDIIPPEFTVTIRTQDGKLLDEFTGFVGENGFEDPSFFRFARERAECRDTDEDLNDFGRISIGTYSTEVTNATIFDRKNNVNVDIEIVTACDDTANQYELQTIFQIYEHDTEDFTYTCLDSDMTDCSTSGDRETRASLRATFRRGEEYEYWFRARGATSALECDDGTFECYY